MLSKLTCENWLPTSSEHSWLYGHVRPDTGPRMSPRTVQWYSGLDSSMGTAVALRTQRLRRERWKASTPMTPKATKRKATMARRNIIWAAAYCSELKIALISVKNRTERRTLRPRRARTAANRGMKEPGTNVSQDVTSEAKSSRFQLSARR